MRAAIDHRINQKMGCFRVIPVILPGGRRDQRSKLPTFLVAATWVEFRKSLDEEQAIHRLVCGIRGLEPGLGPEQVIIEGMCPYRGLQTFQAEHALFFFGREALTEWLLNELRSVPRAVGENRFLAIIGASGSGKSSLARAGLIPALKHGELAGSQEWPIVICRPGQEPVESLTVALAAEPALREQVPSVRDFMSDLRQDERTLHLMIRTALHRAPETHRVVILVDQFEEIFTLCQDDLLRRALIDNLLYAASVMAGKSIVILTMRADFYGKCALYNTLAAALSDHQVLVGPLTEDELRRAIERPAQLVGCELEAGLTELLIHDFKNQAGALPLLQHALSELWKKREGRRLTPAAYEGIGRLDGALERRANEIFDSFNETRQEMCKRLFMRLIQPGKGTEDTKRRARFQELLPAEGDSEPIDQVIQTLADARLITTGGGKDRMEERFIEVAHEALIRGWSKLRLWIDSDRQALLIQRRLSDASAEWAHSGRNDSYLYVGVRLAEAEEWSHTHTDVLNPLEQEFLRASIELRNKKREAELRQKQFRRRAVLAMGGGVVAVLLAIFAFLCFFHAQKARREAQKAHQEANVLSLAFASQSQLGVNNERALLLAVEAGRAMETMEDSRFVVDEVDKALRSVLLYQGDTLHILSGHTNKVLCATWNLEGTRVLTASGDSTARVWDAENGKELACLTGHTDGVNHAAWNMAGTRIVTASGDSTARVWDAENGKELACFTGHTACVRQAAWNRAGTRIVTASDDSTARVWDAENGKELACLIGHTACVRQAAWNRAGTRIVTASEDSTARVWDAENGKELACLTGHTDWVYNATWNRAGTRIVTASEDGTARVWDAENGKELVCLSGHTAWVYDVAWNRVGTRIITASFDGTARVWDAENGKEVSRLSGHTASVYDVDWNRAGTKIVTASFDGTARVWDAQKGKELACLSGHTGWVYNAAWNRAGTRIVTASNDQTARIWDPASSGRISIMKGHTASVNRAAWNRAGTRIVTASEDSTARVWGAENGRELACLTGHTAGVYDAAWNRAGTRIVTAGEDGTARVYAENGKELACLTGHTASVNQAAWNRAGARIVTAGEDGTARVWEAESGKELFTLDHNATIRHAAWNRTGTKIVTASFDGTARVWDAQKGKELACLTGHTASVYDAAWNRAGTRIVTASFDGTARVHYLLRKDMLDAACRRAVRNMTKDEWKQYMGDQPYRMTCP